MSDTRKSEASAADDLVLVLTPDRLRGLMQDRGYRVELATDEQGIPYLRSATNGFGFEVRFANRLANDETGYVDVALLAGLRVQGTLPLEIVNDWNNAKRFARLHLAGDLLILDMDISVLGGVTTNHLHTQIEIWDRLVQELISYLREAVRTLAATNGADPAVAVEEPHSELASD